MSSSWLFQKIVDQLHVELLQFELLNPFYKEAPKSSWYFVSFCRIALTYCQNPTTFLLAESFAATTLIRFLVDVFHICNPSSRTNCKLHLSELSYWLTLFKLTVCCFHHVILSYILSDNLHLWRTINCIVNCSIGGGLVSMFIIKYIIAIHIFCYLFNCSSSLLGTWESSQFFLMSCFPCQGDKIKPFIVIWYLFRLVWFKQNKFFRGLILVFHL